MALLIDRSYYFTSHFFFFFCNDFILSWTNLKQRCLFSLLIQQLIKEVALQARIGSLWVIRDEGDSQKGVEEKDHLGKSP